MAAQSTFPRRCDPGSFDRARELDRLAAVECKFDGMQQLFFWLRFEEPPKELCRYHRSARLWWRDGLPSDESAVPSLTSTKDHKLQMIIY